MNLRMMVLLSLLLLQQHLFAQLSLVAGPGIAPIGCPIAVTMSNDTPAPVMIWSTCPFSVNSGGALIFSFTGCPFTLTPLAPGATLTSYWNQLDNSGFQVPTGTYTITVPLPPFPGGGVATAQVSITGTSTGLVLRGAPRIGTTRGFDLCAPLDGGRGFVFAASLGTQPGYATCAGLLPLNPDPLFELSLTPNNPYFLNFQGVLDPQGRSASPSIAIPFLPSIIGETTHFAFVAYDPTTPCLITRISYPLSLTFQ